MAETLEEYVKRQKVQNPVAAKILHKIHKSLTEAGDPIVNVYDGEETTPVTTRKDVDLVVWNLADAFLNTRSGGWVRFVPSNEWDCIVDYTLNLEEALAAVNAYVDKYN